MFNFGDALEWLKKGYKVFRCGWNGKGMWLKMQVPDANSKMGMPYLYMHTAQGPLVPWTASQTDILAEDWSVLDLPVSVEEPGVLKLDSQAAAEAEPVKA